MKEAKAIKREEKLAKMTEDEKASFFKEEARQKAAQEEIVAKANESRNER